MIVAVQGLTIRRTHAPAYAAECDATAAVFIAARRAMLPGLRLAHTDEETYRWMRDVVFPRHSVWLADVAGEIVGRLKMKGLELRDEGVMRYEG